MDELTHDNEAGWTFETLRIHLLSIMNEREKAHDKAIEAALAAVKDGKANILALALAGSTVVAALVALLTFFATKH
jgi:hypothetical protein